MSSGAARARRQRQLAVLLLLLAVAAAVGWWLWRTLGTTPVDAILARPDYYNGRIVVISGEVQASASLLGAGFMQVADKTGSIWVAKRGAVPRRGGHVRVRGRVNTLLQMDDVTVVGIEAQ